MLDEALLRLGAERLLWGSDLTMETGLAKLMGFEVIRLSADDVRRHSLAATRGASFPPGSFPRIERMASTPAAHA